jgi:DNA-directed RNA polymerase subunit RPC12/RpoP
LVKTKLKIMSLINCSECNNSISDKAISCPYCGYPLVLRSGTSNNVNDNNPFELSGETNFPENLTQDLNIGKQITNWWGNASIRGFYELTENDFDEVPYGEVEVILHTHGIRIGPVYAAMYPIHNYQIISMVIANREMLSEIDSKFEGTSFKNDALSVINFFYLVIQFWDIKSKKAQNLFISCKEAREINGFLKRHDKERMKNNP